MKADIHPDYRMVLFRDVSCGWQILTRSTIKTREVATVEGVDYPVVNVDVSSASHLCFTGTQKNMDTARSIERYYRKYGFTRPPEPDDEPKA